MSGPSRAPWWRLTSLSVVFGCDLRTLALFRINLALLILIDLAMRSGDLVAHYTDDGILPRADYLAILNTGVLSLHFISGSATVQVGLFLIAAVIAVALLVGYRTRMATVLSWILLLSLQDRNHMILQGSDVLLLLLLFWAMFLPLGARFSVDRALALGEPPPTNRFFSVATVAVLIQCMCVYFFSALLKTSPVYLPEGTAIYYTLQLDTFATPIGHWLANFPTIMHWLTYYVWWLELLGPFLMFVPLFFLTFRLFTQASLILMHIGFLLCLTIGLFPLISIVSLLIFTPGAVWDWLERRTNRGDSDLIQVFYDGHCDFCRKTCDLLRTFLMLPGAIIKPAQDTEHARKLMEEHNSWVVLDTAGHAHLRWDALTWLIARSPLFWPIARPLSRLERTGDRIYGWIAANRGRFSGPTANWLKYRYLEYEPAGAANIVVGFFLALILHANLETIGVHIRIPEVMNSVYTSLRLYQNWNMFAPYPMDTDDWIVPAATLNNGMVVDPRATSVTDPDWSKPSNASAFYPNHRWRKFLLNTLKTKNAQYRPLYAHYLCRRWNAANVDEFHIKYLRIVTMAERTLPDYRPADIERYLYWEGECPVDDKAEQHEPPPGAL